ncbi:MAG: hypothetical protein GC164_03960 [Phycisphaera sp.]|nr:hypothetical protein [Phycisphaera sp.]
MKHEPTGEYYDYKKTMKPERPWIVDWHQRFVYRHFNASRSGTGFQSGDPAMAANRPRGQRWTFGDGSIQEVCMRFEDSLEAIRRVSNITCNIPQMVLLTGWQYEGHDSKYPAWGEVCKYLKREQDATALDSLRWLFREARRYNCLVTLHVNMFDAYADSPLFDEYLEKDIIAKDPDSKPIIGNRWSGMDCYHISYTQEWKHGLTQKRIDNLLEMVPELRENGCVYIDAFLGARMKDQNGPISPYLGYSKEEEANTIRKILRYWREHGVDPAVEHAWGMRVDRCVGLTPYAADSRNLSDLPDALYTTSPYHAQFDDVKPPPDFVERFCLETLPYYHSNHPAADYDYGGLGDNENICMPALWCDKPALIAYSKHGYAHRRWRLPRSWQSEGKVDVCSLTVEGPKPLTTLAVSNREVFLVLQPKQAVRITPHA